jgi:metallo-beta-lactamase family protein
MKIQFEGAARTVTGSKFVLETKDGLKILLDCGMYQGRSEAKDNKNRHLGFDPASIDFAILSHAHIDHSGMLPRIVKEGFKGNIYCTEPTYALCQIMLADSAHIQQSDFNYSHKHRFLEDEEEPLYDIDDVVQTMELFRPLSYGEWHHLHDDVALMFTYVGHILGSGCVNLRVKEGKKTHRIAYTGDIGRKNQQIIKGWEPFPQAEIVITESTYGDWLHEDPGSTLDRLHRIVMDTCIENKGKLIIPSFSLGRTQEIVHALDRLESKGKLPPIKVFVDSPLSTNATEIVKSFPEHYNDELRKYMERDSNPFGFAHLHYIRDAKYSKMLNTLDEPCIIISASGMAEAGRIVHHIKNNVENPRNTILFVGYCEPSSLGGRLRAGAELIKIFGQELKVKARVEIMDSYSAHGDYEEMIEFLKCQEAHLIKHLFLVHGTYDRQVKYKEHLKQAGFHHIYIPEEDEVFEV